MLWAVPVVATRRLMDELTEMFDHVVPGELVAYAREQGVNPPTIDPGWVIGAQPQPDGHNRLVWYQPSKIEAIHKMADRVARQWPDATELLLVHGAAWDDWSVMVTQASLPKTESADEDEFSASLRAVTCGDVDSVGCAKSLGKANLI